MKMEEEHYGLREDLTRLIRRAYLLYPRNMQSAVGPSAVGLECDRSLAFAAKAPQREAEMVERARKDEPTENASTANSKPQFHNDPIPSIVGTSVHAWLENAAGIDNGVEEALGEERPTPRWLTERKLKIATPDGYSIEGSCDLFDQWTGTVIDWKVVGATTLRTVNLHGPSAQYRVQSQLYGLGYQQLGLEVKEVAVCFIPRNGPLREVRLFTQPFDPALATLALKRLQGLEELSQWEQAKPSPTPKNCRYCAVPLDECPEGLLNRVER